MPEETQAPRKEKDLWDKLQIVFHPLNGLLTALAVALLGYYTSAIVRENEASQTNKVVYSELATSREQADSLLRKDMFASIINTFVRPETATLEARMLNLELLTYNFHESLNLKPLFAHMKRQILVSDKASQQEYGSRLRAMAKEIATHQMVLLEQVGAKFSRTVDFDALKKSGGYLELMPETLVLDKSERQFSLAVLSFDPEMKEIGMEMGVRTMKDSSTMQTRKFSVGEFDFPMIDNTRLSGDQRAAVVLTNSSDSSAEITLVYFPGSYASLKEKSSYDEVVEQLRGFGQQPQQ